MLNADAPVALLIDNDEGMVEAIAARLRAAGVRCVTAGSGAQGIALFDKEYIDVVITDLAMPGGGGTSVVESIRRHSDVPIIVITGYREVFDHELHFIPGVSLLRKPFDSGDLLARIELELATREDACQARSAA
ncbi:MAG: response regulator [Phycisphaerales bacterium]